MWNPFSFLFKKKETQTYPPEFAIIVYNENALRNGIEDSSNKLVIRYKFNYRTEKLDVFRVYGYSESILYNLKKKLKIPVYDQTAKEIKFAVYDEINLSEISYDKG